MPNWRHGSCRHCSPRRAGGRRSRVSLRSFERRGRDDLLQRLARLGLPDVEEHIRTEVSFLPQDWQDRYNLPLGSTHGLSHKLTQMAYLRPHNRHSRYHNLYFVGASTHPGTGVPTVLISAALAANRILEDAGR